MKVANSKLQKVYGALRAAGDTTVPMAQAIRMSEVQDNIADHMKRVNDINNALIVELGTVNKDGQEQVGPELPNWKEFVQRADELQAVEYELGEPLVLYEKDGQYGWTPDVKTAISLTPNTMADLGAFLVIQGEAAQVEEPTLVE